MVISISEDGPAGPGADGLAEYLAWHGVEARCIEAEGTRHSSGPLVAQHVRDCGADMLVMGAYTRDRFRT